MFDSHHPTADPKNYLEYTVGGAECPFTTFYSIILFETQITIFVILAVNIQTCTS